LAVLDGTQLSPILKIRYLRQKSVIMLCLVVTGCYPLLDWNSADLLELSLCFLDDDAACFQLWGCVLLV